ncbi:MAG: 3-hydroxyacyl-ACP dehydratase FabZ family protein [Pseudomonadota bacterium]|nr:3-hydroxyacyl-ACP dehydratase FabZ family protein [Pseudomonadota bacterium]
MKLKLNKKLIYEYQQNREPYLLIDEASEVIPGKSAKGFKILKKDEWFFKVHWPDDPNMPGMLQIESLVQMCALAILTLPDNKGKVVYLTSANNLKFLKKILPDTKLEMVTEIKSFKRGLAICQGEGFVKNELVCKAEFNLVLPGEIRKYSLK